MILPGFPRMMGRKPLVYEEVQSLPPMTSDTLPLGQIASASNVVGPGYEAYRAFTQGAQANPWVSIVTPPQWLQRQVPAPIMVWKYRIEVGNASAQAPTSWQFMGSNDGASWSTLDTRSGVTWVNFETKEFEVPLPLAKFSYHRLNVTAAGTSGVAIYEFELLQVL